ncbi:MAG: type I phosphomannose isomerase catalytic subunit [Anaerobutyricum soehngenii]
MSIVANGSLKGRTLKSIIDEYGYDLMGNKVSVERFPLLIKLIDAGERLSVQVHPDD